MRRNLISMMLMLLDATVVTLASCLALLVRFDGVVQMHYFNVVINYLAVTIFIRLIIFYAFGLYHRLWRYAGVNELLSIVGAVSLSSLIIILYMSAKHADLPRSIQLLSWLFNILLVGGSRMFIRVVQHARKNSNPERDRVLIVGAGDAGAMIAREIKQRYYDAKVLIGFVDDDPYKQHKMLFGARVLGRRSEIHELVQRYKISEIIIAMPSINGGALREIIQECQQFKCAVKTLPGLYELIDGKVTVQQLRNIELEDLLRRDPVQLDIAQIAKYLTGKRVLVTGAGGSIGSELCRQIAKMSPATLVLLGKGENSIYEIHRELGERYPKLELEHIIADVRDQERINAVFKQTSPQVVFHAAAHKHVPLMERQPEEAVRNNIFGTRVIAEAADRSRAEMFIMISTDKAVNPSSVMGATKRVAELIIQNLNSVSKTKFAAVRFGNVLGSRGSVVPLFRHQIAGGGPITVTHPDMRRYFMTIPEATQLVLQAGAMAQGGEVFVLDMGEPVKITDMACDLIKLSGLVPYQDIDIKFTGIRPGEKLFEELLTAEEGTTATRHAKIFQANIRSVDEATLHNSLLLLRQATHGVEIVTLLTDLVPSFRTAKKVEEPISKEAATGQTVDEHGRHVAAVPATLH